MWKMIVGFILEKVIGAISEWLKDEIKRRKDKKEIDAAVKAVVTAQTEEEQIKAHEELIRVTNPRK